MTFKTTGNKENKKGTTAGGKAIVTTDDLRDIRNKTEKGQKADAAILSNADLERMKGSTKI